jgi:hypothetical protein
MAIGVFTMTDWKAMFDRQDRYAEDFFFTHATKKKDRHVIQGLQ